MKVALIGSGSWGTAIAGVAAQKADTVCMWAHSEDVCSGINTAHRNPRYLCDYELPGNVSASNDLERVLNHVDSVIFAVPSVHLRGISHDAAAYIAEDVPILCLTKGIEADTGYLMSEVIASEIGHPERVAALSGPNHAEEICKGGLSAAVVAAEEDEIAEHFKSLLISPMFRIYVAHDMAGVETCGAMKNVIAIVCGIAAGSGLGDNSLALIMTRGLAEISRVVHARGGEALTCMGLAGMGDLVATCTSPHSRNRSFGVAFVSGTSLEEYQQQTHMVVEGAAAANSIAQLARKLGVDVPLTFALDKTLKGEISISDALSTLTARVPSEEFYGLSD